MFILSIYELIKKKKSNLQVVRASDLISDSEMTPKPCQMSVVIQAAIHPSTSAYLMPRPPGPSGNTNAFPSQLRDKIPPAFNRSALGPPPGWTCPEHLPWEASKRHPK